MTSSNPLRRDAANLAPIRPLNWHDIVAERNANMGRHDIKWAVNANGDGIHMRHRNASNGPWREFKPEPGELEATQAVVARAIAAGVSQEQWNDLVRKGVITREVQKTIRENVAMQDRAA